MICVLREYKSSNCEVAETDDELAILQKGNTLVRRHVAEWQHSYRLYYHNALRDEQIVA